MMEGLPRTQSEMPLNTKPTAKMSLSSLLPSMDAPMDNEPEQEVENNGKANDGEDEDDEENPFDNEDW